LYTFRVDGGSNPPCRANFNVIKTPYRETAKTMTKIKDDARLALQLSLSHREPTWRVAESILALDVVDSKSDLHKELKALAGSASWSSEMNDDYDKVDPADTQLVTFSELFPNISTAKVAGKNVYDAGYVAQLNMLVLEALESLGVPLYDHTSVNPAGHALQNRYDYDWAAGDATSKKAFVKRLRFLQNFEEKADRVTDVLNLRHAQMQAKSRLAYAVDVTKVDDLSLAFIAYLAARANRRSLFMLGGQSKAFDNISDGLKALLNKDSAWEQIAYVLPTTQAFKQLDSETLGRLLGKFHTEMTVASNALGKMFPSLPQRMREEMVMVKGVDSSSWNAYAGALNTMRSAWISATLAAGLGTVFDSYLPGKSPRLIASDIAWWARSNGDDLHEDTRMFSKLPYPWEVISGSARLNREQILAVAASENLVDAEKSGWVGPRTDVKSEVAEAEPASLHGVILSDPALVARLRSVGAFSGKGQRPMNDQLETLLDGFSQAGCIVLVPVKGNVISENLVTLSDTLGGPNTLANLLNVTFGQIIRWVNETDVPNNEDTRVIKELANVVDYLSSVWAPSVMGTWLTSSNAFLEGARPIDYIRLKGFDQVLEAIDAEFSGVIA
jgi:hypothetical protein